MTVILKQGVTKKTSPLMNVPTKERKRLIARERKIRRTGQWGEWERLENPHRFKSGWLGEVDHVRRNRVFSVLVRDVGTAIHLGISSLTGDRPSFHEMQRIKNDLAGPNATGVEVYPPQEELVDDAEMFHLWVLFAPLPFSLFSKEQDQ
ncbi:hypothetical protein GCM10016455_05880 [Aliiroseovarius zhejiangensis]|uniref:DUF7694 domain-containing protein n=1 Tax=Aliiroseovarius zhejiangensis TaxID=1632025 RepID=A0ABQ3IN28_9RHOB|nr:hypothetical protein [Aliiroseovarius zhejiangensis]GHE88575.1 hypothetical protein GCM10016455_05880 [Aliiroseovarius zhejiangensis]